LFGRRRLYHGRTDKFWTRLKYFTILRMFSQKPGAMIPNLAGNQLQL
jgi:hypothetical protein